MNPEEATDTPAVRTRRHVLGDLEGVVEEPRAGVDDTEDHKVLWLDVVEVRLVRNAKSTPSRVADVVGMDDCCRLPRAGQVSAGVTDVTTKTQSVKIQEVAEVSDAPLRRGVVVCVALVAGDLNLGRTACRELKNILWVRWVVEVAVLENIARHVNRQLRRALSRALTIHHCEKGILYSGTTGRLS